jgi:hypothetical protein
MIEEVDTTSRPALSSRWGSVALLGATIIFLWQLRHPFVRFASPVVNESLGFLLGLGLPWLTLSAIFRVGRWWSKALAIAAILPLLLYSFVFLFGLLMTALAYNNGHDLSFDGFAETPCKGSDVRFYRTNGGATTDYGVVIRHEKILFPGVLLVRTIDNFYPCYSLDATPTDSGITITDKSADCDDFREQSREYRLKRFIYF